MGLFDIVLKHLWRNKSKALFLALGIIIGVTTIVTLYTITISMEKEVSDKFDEIGSNMIILPKSESLALTYGGITIQSRAQSEASLPEDSINRIRNIKNEENIAVIAPKLLGAIETDGGKALAIGVDFTAEFMMKKWWELEGEAPTAFNHVILGNDAASALNKSVGSKIFVDDIELVVSGILEKAGSEEDNGLYLSLPLLQELLNKEGILSFIEISALCYTCPIEDIVTQISNKLPEAEVTAVLEAVEARKAIVDKFSTLARTVSLTVFFIGFLIVANSVLVAVSSRTKEIGILRSLGFKKLHVAGIIVLENMLVSLVGGIMGYFFGMFLAKWLTPLIAQMEVLILWEWKLAITSLVIATSVGMLASAIPVIKVVTKNPSQSMKLI